MRSQSTVFTGCEGTLASGHPVAGEVFDTNDGKIIPLPRPALTEGEELVEQACTVTAAQDGTPRIIFLTTTKVPSRGLEPESQQTNISAFDLHSPGPLLTKPLPSGLIHLGNSTVVEEISPTDGGFLLTGGSNDSTNVASFDAATLEMNGAWSRVDGPRGGPLIFSNFNSFAAMDPLDRQVHFFNTKGDEIGFFDNCDNVSPTSHGYVLTHGDVLDPDRNLVPTGGFYFDSLTHELLGPIFPPAARLTLKTGTLSDPDNAEFGDELLLVSDAGTAYASQIVIYNTRTHHEIFSLGPEKLDGLHIQNIRLGGNYLYFLKDPDNPVIDSSTGKSVSAGWSLRVLQEIANDWVLIQPESPQQAGRANFASPYLARGGSGKYDGPWY